MIAVIIYGPPGSGKGTQANLLAGNSGFFHLDTGDYLRTILHGPNFRKNKITLRERKLNDSGKLNTPSWVLKIIGKRAREIAKLKQSIVLSGSPRTVFEALGDPKNKGMMKILERAYGKKNILVFLLDIPPRESFRRNSKRSSCYVCKTVLLAKYGNLKSCPFCGGEIKRRRDDKKEIILTRLEEYRSRTLPIINELKRKKYRIIKLSGLPAPYKIHKKITSYLK